jgi:hypothetical protein
MENKLRITKDEIDGIYEISSFNLDLLKEAMRQVELRIHNEDGRKERIDKRAYTLFSVLIGLIGLTPAASKFEYISNIIIVPTALLLITASIFLFRVLKSEKYAALGTMPFTWLQKEFIKNNQGESDNNDNKMLGYVLSHILFDVNESLIVSHESNEKRILLLDKALLTCLIALLPTCLFFLCKLCTILCKLRAVITYL